MGYIRVKFGFWALQPVFHVYNLSYMIWPPGIINHNLPEKNKYTNFKNIETTVYDELSELKINKFINFIKTNYLRNKENVYLPKKENIIPYFTSHNAKSFFSFYTEDNLLHDLKKGTIIKDKQIIGVITGRPLHISINKHDNVNNDNANKDNETTSTNKFDAYYIDYLCIDKSYRKKGIAQQIIQTHYYNQSYVNKSITVSLFKREEELTGIVPLCVYSTYGFHVKKWTKPDDLHPEYVLLEITPQNFHFLLDFIKENNNNFDIVINSDISNIIELIKTKNIFIYTILINNKIICAYFFRKSCTFIEKGLEVLSCFASINDCDSDELFIHGFKISFWKIAEINNFGFSAIENISHNNIIINNLLLKTHPLIISPTAYFFYNFAYHTFNPEKVLIIN
jgi:predicted GNAT family acetyltransferase